MLRESSKTIDTEVDAGAAVLGATEDVPHASLLAGFVSAVMQGDDAAARSARSTLADAAGPAAVVDAAAVLANFEMMTRVADSTGAVLSARWIESSVADRATLGADGFRSVR